MLHTDASRSIHPLRARPRLLILAIGMLTLTACVVGPDYHEPAAPAETSYDLTTLPAQEHVDQTGPRLLIGAPVATNWWTELHNPALDATEVMALNANNTLVAAKATLRQADQTLAQSRAAYWPQIDLTGGVERNSAGTFAPSGGGTSSNSWYVGPTASYLADLFGATSRAVERSAAQRDFERTQLLAADLVVSNGVATQALAIASTRRQISSAEEVIAGDMKNLAIVERQFAVGKAARNDVLVARAQLLGDRPPLVQLRQQLSVARHALTVLVSRSPADWTPPDFVITDFAVPEQLPTTLPSELVHRRPDILAAERQLHADSAAIGVAVAQFYPTITLSAALTQQSVTAIDLFQGANNLWTLAASVTTPLFHGGALRAQKEAAIATFQAQLATYEQTVIVAFGQVADSLRALDHDAELFRDATAAFDVATSSLAVQRATYAAGKTSLIQLLSSQRAFAQAAQTVTTAQTQQLQDVVQFFTAMGGGLTTQMAAN